VEVQMAKVHVFRGQDRIFGFTPNALGTNLPQLYAPWAIFKAIELHNNEPYQGIDVSACLDDISKHGFHLTAAHRRITHERALVLGGGGASGNAWLIGVIAGLFDAGLDVTEASLIIGTSAGSTTAAQITSAAPTQLLADILAAASPKQSAPIVSDAARVPVRPGADHMERTGRIIGAAEDAADMRRKMGAAALEMEGASDKSVQARWRTTVAARLPKLHWPQQRVVITAVDAHTGEQVVFDSHSEVDLVDAVAASCAGGFAYSIGENAYIDGGYRADVNADLAAGHGRVLIIPPLATEHESR
jgi:NTE family protein